MSRFTGPQYRGASRDAKVIRRQEAADRHGVYVRAGRPGGDTRPRLGRKMREGQA